MKNDYYADASTYFKLLNDLFDITGNKIKKVNQALRKTIKILAKNSNRQKQRSKKPKTKNQPNNNK